MCSQQSISRVVQLWTECDLRTYSSPLLLISIPSHSISSPEHPTPNPRQTLTYCPSQWICLLWVFLKYLLIYFLALLGLPCCTWAFSSCREQGPPASCGAWTALCGGFSYCVAWALGREGFSSCGLPAELSGNTWDLPRPGVWTGISCVARQVLNNWTTREALF